MMESAWRTNELADSVRRARLPFCDLNHGRNLHTTRFNVWNTAAGGETSRKRAVSPDKQRRQLCARRGGVGKVESEEREETAIESAAMTEK